MLFRARRTSVPGLSPEHSTPPCGLTVNTADKRAWVWADGRYIEVVAVDRADQAAMVDQCARGLSIVPPSYPPPRPRSWFARLIWM